LQMSQDEIKRLTNKLMRGCHLPEFSVRCD
jgi:hypothetical protein